MKSHTRSGGSFQSLTPETGEKQEPELNQMPLIKFLNQRAGQDAGGGRVRPKVNVDQCSKDLEAVDDMVNLTNQEWNKFMARVFGLKWEQLRQSVPSIHGSPMQFDTLSIVT
ncbi:hypothetical protein PGIGA_G00252790 [Pangasianodon gigas]|uniref:Uncharacterized protein n=1 Tax=Pangasianodon gigas TaxID=30993 RepID=A0ACC5WQY0_PANGG|nr:hypothetical protein [Pangasianodon gigas]